MDKLRDEMMQRHEALMQKLRPAAVRGVIGVVAASGAGGASIKDAGFWTLRFELENWKFFGGVLQNRKLMVQKDLSESALDELRKRIKADQVIAIRARVIEDETAPYARGLLEEVLVETPADEEILQAARKLKEPVTLEDGQFGVFTLDRRVDWFETKVNWGLVEIKLAFSRDENRAGCLETARRLWAHQHEWDERIRACACAKLRKTKNDSWLQAGEEAVTEQQFKESITPESVTVSAEGQFDFWFDDGDLFGGHSIEVSGSLEEGSTYAAFHG